MLIRISSECCNTNKLELRGTWEGVMKKRGRWRKREREVEKEWKRSEKGVKEV